MICSLDITFRTRALQNLCNDSKAARKALGKRCADALKKRMDDLRAATNLEEMRRLPGRCHELTANRSGQLGLDLEHPKRLVFLPSRATERSSGRLDWSSVNAVEIIEIVDYHGK